MATPNAFYQFISPYLPGISEPMMDQEILRVARDIAVRTHCETVTQRIDSVVNQNAYTLTPGTNREPVRLMDAFYLTLQMDPTAAPDINNPVALVGTIGTNTPNTGSPNAVWTDNPLTQFFVYPVPDIVTTNAFTVRFTVKPTPTSTTVPDILLRYETVVARGVIANCQMIPGLPFSNPAGYAATKFEYENALAAMRAEIARGNIRSNRRVNPVRFM